MGLINRDASPDGTRPSELMGRAARLAAKAGFAVVDVLLGPLPGPRLIIYHQVGAALGRQMEVTVEAFRAQLEWVMEHGTVVDLDTAIEHRGEPTSDLLFVLTFDDGYRDLHRYAFPLLEKGALPFTLYLTTEPVETGRSLGPMQGAEPLNWEEVAEMWESGLMTVGVHTHRHPDLRSLDEAQVGEELETSDELVLRRLGIRPRHFAYPWGYWSETADRLVRRRYNSAALGSGPPIRADSDPYLLHRIPVQRSDGILFFRRKMRGGLRMENVLRRRLRGYRGP